MRKIEDAGRLISILVATGTAGVINPLKAGSSTACCPRPPELPARREAGQPAMIDDSISPFTVPVGEFRFEEEPVGRESLSIGELIGELTNFAKKYQADSNRVASLPSYQRTLCIATRDAFTFELVGSLKKTPGIDGIRTYTLRHLGNDLTVTTARIVLGELIRIGNMSVDDAEQLTLVEAMGVLEIRDLLTPSLSQDSRCKPVKPAHTDSTKAAMIENYDRYVEQSKSRFDAIEYINWLRRQGIIASGRIDNELKHWWKNTGKAQHKAWKSENSSGRRNTPTNNLSNPHQ
jgi:hypothetical protein